MRLIEFQNVYTNKIKRFLRAINKVDANVKQYFD